MRSSEYLEKVKKEPVTLAFWRDGISEFVATFCLVSAQIGLMLFSGVGPHVGIGMALVVIGVGWGLGDFGGGHMNPSITLAMMLTVRITFIRGLVYWVFQMLGGLAGAGFIYAVTVEADRDNLGATTLADSVKVWQGVLIEGWITAMLVITALGATNERRKHDGLFMPTLAIGAALGLGLIIAIFRTGASMNPARSFGPAVVMDIWDDHWVYWVGPLGGAVVASAIYGVFDLFGRVNNTKNKSSDYEDQGTPHMQYGHPLPATAPYRQGSEIVRGVTISDGRPSNIVPRNPAYSEGGASRSYAGGATAAANNYSAAGGAYGGGAAVFRT